MQLTVAAAGVDPKLPGGGGTVVGVIVQRFLAAHPVGRNLMQIGGYECRRQSLKPDSLVTCRNLGTLDHDQLTAVSSRYPKTIATEVVRILAGNH